MIFSFMSLVTFDDLLAAVQAMVSWRDGRQQQNYLFDTSCHHVFWGKKVITAIRPVQIMQLGKPAASLCQEISRNCCWLVLLFYLFLNWLFADCLPGKLTILLMIEQNLDLKYFNQACFCYFLNYSWLLLFFFLQIVSCLLLQKHYSAVILMFSFHSLRQKNSILKLVNVSQIKKNKERECKSIKIQRNKF